MSYERITQWEPAYDKRAEGYGVHGMNVRFVVKNELGATQFLLFTGLDHSSVRRERRIDGYGGHAMPADLGYHSPKPMYEDHTPMGPCEYLDGIPCYYDGSSLNAEDAFDVFTDEGEEALWIFLERYHAATFEDAAYPPELGRRWNSRKTIV